MNDNEITGLFLSRSENAIFELKSKYERLARKAARNILSDFRDVEECLNDSYLAMWNSIPPENPRVLPAYFVAIVRNNALKIYRHNSAMKRNAVTEELTDSSAASPSPEYEINLAADIIGNYLASQNKKARVLFMRRYYLGESVKEAANAVGLTENNARVKLSRMREQLKKLLMKEGISL